MILKTSLKREVFLFYGSFNFNYISRIVLQLQSIGSRIDLYDRVTHIHPVLGGFCVFITHINELPARVADDTTNNDKDKNLQNIDLLYCDRLDCKWTFL